MISPMFQFELRRWRWGRVAGQWLALYAVSLGVAAALGVLWSGDTFYNGVGPRAQERWFFTFAVTQAPVLAVWSAVLAASRWRRLGRSGLLAHALATPLRPAELLWGVGAGAVWPVALWVVTSCLIWTLAALAWGAVPPGAVLFAHALLLAQALAFGLLGAALVTFPGSDRIRAAVAVTGAGAALAAVLAAVFAVGPLLERSARPDWVIYAVLLVNPAVAIGTALELDLLRTPWIYPWTAIPEYRFAYPAPIWTLALYAALAAAALHHAARRLAQRDVIKEPTVRTIISLVTLAAVLTAPVTAAPRTSPGSLEQAIRDAVSRGVAYLKKSQGPDGDWGRYPGISAVAVLGLLRSGLTERDPAVKKGIAYLISKAKPNGAIYEDSNPATALPNYNTALAMTALHATGNAAYRDLVRKAQQFLARSQFDEEEGYNRSHVAYGGIGYGSKPDKPDLSNLQQALEALKETRYDPRAPLWEKAILFLQRCQNRKESNGAAWAGNDGGFVYASDGESKAGGHSSYGSMTYAGLKSYIYCQVDRSDPRVQAAWNWLRSHYSVGENPGMGDAGLYYYYHTMAKTLSVWGQRIITDASGGRHVWKADLAGELIRRQQKDGSWSNTNSRWWEDNKDLVTGYSLMALAYCR